ncbi:MAG: rod shape-determining protein RodA, partial [Candidatus Shapirobacteria bacterium]|nr:rod shape-determining protein RodA [Candidatus Shapirobacteria bacterium]
MLGAAILLVAIGAAMLFSSSYTDQRLSPRFMRQLIALLAAVLAAFFVARTPYHVIQRYALALYGAAIMGIAAVIAIGQVIRGTTSRLSLAGFQLQPSEFMKVALIVLLAWLMARSERLSWHLILKTVLFTALPVAIIASEPDVGVAVLLLATWGGMLFFWGLSWTATLSFGLLGVVTFFASWQWVFADYQKTRLLTFLNPLHDPLGAGYNVTQSIIALGSGRLLGRGLGHGPQSQLKFLPEQHTDFILASIGEELGFIGVAIVLCLYAIILWRILLVAQETRDPFGQLIAVGAFFLLLFSLIVSAGMNMGLLPVTGIPLPLVSYGGSSLLATFIL